MSTTDSSTQYLVGVLGAGRHAVQSHLRPVLDLGHRALVWDPDPAALARLSDLPVEVASSQEEVLARAGAVVICSPDRFHTPTLLACVEAGVPALVEKPAAVTREDLDLLGPVLLEGSAVVSTCHPRRTDPPFLELARMLPELLDELGAVRAVSFDFDYPVPRAGQPQLHTSLLSDHLGHELDLVEFLLGVPEVFEARNALGAGLDPQVNYRVEGCRSDGVELLFSGRRTDPEQRHYEEVLRIEFEHGHVEVGSEEGSSRIVSPRSTRALALPGTEYDTRFLAVNANFLASVSGSVLPYVSKHQIWRNTLATVELDTTGTVRLERPES